MTATSPLPGIWLGFQLFVSLQLPPAVLVQTMFAACAEVAAIMSAAAAKEKIPRVFMISDLSVISNFNPMSRIADEQSPRQCILGSDSISNFNFSGCQHVSFYNCPLVNCPVVRRLVVPFSLSTFPINAFLPDF